MLHQSNDAIQPDGQQDADGRAPYGAFMRLLPRVAPHVDHQHVLRLEGLLLAGTFLPAAHELLLLAVDVVVVDVLCGEEQALVNREAKRRPLAGRVRSRQRESETSQGFTRVAPERRPSSITLDSYYASVNRT